MSKDFEKKITPFRLYKQQLFHSFFQTLDTKLHSLTNVGGFNAVRVDFQLSTFYCFYSNMFIQMEQCFFCKKKNCTTYKISSHTKSRH